ncbi:anti-sigma factor family protein [Histidinibacterium aquaticum]|uniref:Anti-sigma factor n=1 Tax=Histidinibacterium aquaticum TaxID=2613962 RepID=A0A5J5GCK3_9RHOB|nr:anti-sigma factor [Histidinibacterium aquaticum]KAA9005761.1 anti-sigma factor [Histidinibacterium aquaticum]
MRPSDTLDVNAYLDGELGPEEAAQIEARLEDDPEALAQLETFARQKDDVAYALASISAKTPPNLKTARLERRLANALYNRTRPDRGTVLAPVLRGAVQLAAACAFVAVGWWGHANWTPPTQGVPEYVSEAVGAHQVFAEDLDRPAEFTPASIDSATEWFSTKIGVPVAAPDLGRYELTLVGARLLGTKEGPLAQFIYEGDGGARYSLTLARHPDDRPLSPLQVVDYPGRSVGYWSTPNLDFALVGSSDRPELQDIVTTLASNI